MKKILIIALSLALGFTASAQVLANLGVTDVTMTHEGYDMTVQMTVDLSTVLPYSNTAVTLVPIIFKGETAAELKPMGVYSRGRFYSIARAARTSEPFAAEELKYLDSKAPTALKYKDVIPYEDWMDGSRLRIDARITGCCDKPQETETGYILAEYVEPEPPAPVIIEFVPNYIYVQPDANVQAKERSVSGEAFVIFRSGKTNLEPGYENNQAELDKIKATIDSVRMDNDIMITKVTLRGYSSPDGKYANNEKFAKQRTETLKEYVSGLYPMPDDIWATEFVAENWEGLRKAVEESDQIGSKEKILALIDSDAAPDKKEARLKANFPKDYKYISTKIFPTLRRTDYKVNFTVRSYTTVEEVRQILRTKPWNLSIEEFFLAAKDLKPGTAEFNNVFATAAKVFPFDEIANINAANAFMASKDLKAAERYINRMGDSTVAKYTKGVFKALSEDFEGARTLFKAAEAEGLKEASQARSLVDLIIEQRATLNL